MKVISVPMHCFASNCYLVTSEKGNCAVIDPGMEPETIINAIEQNGLTPKMILLTHGHYDHCSAVPGLKERYPDIQLMAAAKEADLLADPRKNYSLTATGVAVTLTPDRLLKEGDKIELDELEFIVWETPGHTAGCLTFFCGDAVFTGDTLFVQSCGRTDMYSSDFMDMVDSLTRLRSVKTNYHMYPGHEQDGMLFDQYAWIDSLVARIRAAYGR